MFRVSLLLFQAQDDVTNRMEHIEALEKELLTKNEAIEELRKEKQLKAEETVKAQLVTLISILIMTFRGPYNKKMPP